MCPELVITPSLSGLCHLHNGGGIGPTISREVTADLHSIGRSCLYRAGQVWKRRPRQRGGGDGVETTVVIVNVEADVAVVLSYLKKICLILN